MKGQKTGGRSKGTPNKVSMTLKQAVLETFQRLGGVSHMTAWARQNPNEYYRLAAKLIPSGAPVQIDGLTGSMAEQGFSIIRNLAAGAITPDQAGAVMQVLLAQVRVLEVDELERRVKLLEESQNGKTDKANRAP